MKGQNRQCTEIYDDPEETDEVQRKRVADHRKGSRENWLSRARSRLGDARSRCFDEAVGPQEITMTKMIQELPTEVRSVRMQMISGQASR